MTNYKQQMIVISLLTEEVGITPKDNVDNSGKSARFEKQHLLRAPVGFRQSAQPAEW